MSLLKKIKPAFWNESKPTDDSHIRLFNYAGVWKNAVLGASIIALFPLVMMFLINHYGYKKAMKEKMSGSIVCFVSNARSTLSAMISARKAILSFIVNDRRLNEFPNPNELGIILSDLKSTFGEFVDLSLVDSKKNRKIHAGPNHLRNKDDRDEVWYQQASGSGVYISDIFMGNGGFPYFVMAVKGKNAQGNSLILRASLKAAWLEETIRALDSEPNYDPFVVNGSGVLQTASRRYGKVFEPLSLPLPFEPGSPKIRSFKDRSGDEIVGSSALIEGSPFRLVTTAPQKTLTGGWFPVSNRFVLLMVASMVGVLLITMGVVTHLLNRIFDADRRRVAVLHNIQYTNRMATMGRLSAGVAHEINNPLAIINEKAGLLKDLISMGKDLPREKTVEIVDSILSSINRCSAITHSLLGFAKHIDVQFQEIDLERIIRELMLFVGKEAEYRSISIDIKIQDTLRTIESDVGQLEQVFLNIINNAFEAVDEFGQIDIELYSEEPESVSVRISDDGHGISEENLKHIFDPFFSTKGEKGAGLGLSISYGILEKLGGRLDVESKKGEGSRFTVTLPVKIKR